MDICSKQSVEASPHVRIVMFASAVSALMHDDDNFPGIVQGSLSSLMLHLGMVTSETVDQFFGEPVILACVGIFIVTCFFTVFDPVFLFRYGR